MLLVTVICFTGGLWYRGSGSPDLLEIGFRLVLALTGIAALLDALSLYHKSPGSPPPVMSIPDGTIIPQLPPVAPGISWIIAGWVILASGLPLALLFSLTIFLSFFGAILGIFCCLGGILFSIIGAARGSRTPALILGLCSLIVGPAAYFLGSFWFIFLNNRTAAGMP